MPLPQTFASYFRDVEGTEEDITRVASHFLEPVIVGNAADAADVWLKQLREICGTHPQGSETSSLMAFLYIANHVLQTAGDKGTFVLSTIKRAFASVLPHAIALICRTVPSLRKQVARLLVIWRQRRVYGPKTLDKLEKVIRGEIRPGDEAETGDDSRYYFSEEEGDEEGVNEDMAIAAAAEGSDEDEEETGEDAGGRGTAGALGPTPGMVGSDAREDVEKIARAIKRKREGELWRTALRSKIQGLPGSISAGTLLSGVSARDWLREGDAARPPFDLKKVCKRLEDVEGVVQALIDALPVVSTPSTSSRGEDETNDPSVRVKARERTRVIRELERSVEYQEQRLALIMERTEKCDAIDAIINEGKKRRTNGRYENTRCEAVQGGGERGRSGSIDGHVGASINKGQETVWELRKRHRIDVEGLREAARAKEEEAQRLKKEEEEYLRQERERLEASQRKQNVVWNAATRSFVRVTAKAQDDWRD